jgi:hypothetical protein
MRRSLDGPALEFGASPQRAYRCLLNSARAKKETASDGDLYR